MKIEAAISKLTLKKLFFILLLFGTVESWAQGLFVSTPGYVVFRDSTLPTNDQLVQWFEFESMMDRRSVNGRGYIIFNGTDKRKVQVSSEHILKIIEKSKVDSSLLSSPAVIGDYKNLYSELINISKINNNVAQKSAPLISMMGDSIKKLDGQKTTIPNASQISVGTITTKDGSVYSNAVIKSSNDAYVTVQHNDGVTRIMLPNLPDSLQTKYKYNPEKSASFLAAEKESRKRLAQSQIEEQRKLEEKNPNTTSVEQSSSQSKTENQSAEIKKDSSSNKSKESRVTINKHSAKSPEDISKISATPIWDRTLEQFTLLYGDPLKLIGSHYGQDTYVFRHGDYTLIISFYQNKVESIELKKQVGNYKPAYVVYNDVATSSFKTDECIAIIKTISAGVTWKKISDSGIKSDDGKAVLMFGENRLTLATVAFMERIAKAESQRTSNSIKGL